jgi:hypothetical protein
MDSEFFKIQSECDRLLQRHLGYRPGLNNNPQPPSTKLYPQPPVGAGIHPPMSHRPPIRKTKVKEPKVKNSKVKSKIKQWMADIRLGFTNPPGRRPRRR